MTEILIHDQVSRDRVVNFISCLSDQKKWRVTVVQHRKQRSNPQNRTWHGWFRQMSLDSGDTEHNIKEEAIRLFCPKVQSSLTGEFVNKRTSQLTTEEGVEFMARVYQWACEFGIYLQHPDDQGAP